MMEGILKIENGVLKKCTDEKITSVAIPDGVTGIDWTAFRKCAQLQSLFIPGSVRYISKAAFKKCSSLAKITLSDDFEKVPSEWFDILNLTNPNYEIVCTKDSATFKTVNRSPKLRTHVKEIALQIAKEKKVLEVKMSGAESLLGALLENIGDSSFEIFQNKKGADVALVKVGKNAGCFKLRGDGSRWFPKLQKVVEAFSDSSKSGAEILDMIEKQKLPLAEIPPSWLVKTDLKADAEGNLRIFASGALNELQKYEGVKAIELFGIAEIGNWAFSGCKSIESVVIPSSVTKIGEHSFASCKSLSSVEIPSSVTEIGRSAFCLCTSLSSVVIPEGITEISRETFYGCASLSSVVIPPGVTKIGPNAFKLCALSELSHPCLTIKDGLAVKGNKVEYCASQKSAIAIPDGFTEIGKHTFCNCKSLVSVKIPGSVTQIGDNAFEHCESLQSVQIPFGVEKIGMYTFYQCKSLSSVMIPSSVKEIGEGAFKDCKSLSSVEFGGTVAQWDCVGKELWADDSKIALVKCADGEVGGSE